MAYGFSVNCSQTEIGAISVGAGGSIKIARSGLLSSYYVSQNSPTTSDISRVSVQVSGNDVEVVICCLDGTIYSTLNPSSGGTTWTWISNTVPSPGSWYDMTYYLGNYYVVGAGGRIYRRAFNTTTWTALSSGVSADIYCITASSSRLLAGMKGVVGSVPSVIYSDSTGSSWSSAGTINFSPNAQAVVSSIASNGSIHLVGTYWGVYYSTNLSTWTRSSVASQQAPVRVLYSTSQNLFYSVGIQPSGTNYIYKSSDGISWSSSTGDSFNFFNTTTTNTTAVSFFEDAYLGPCAFHSSGSFVPIKIGGLSYLNAPSSLTGSGSNLDTYGWGLGNISLLYNKNTRDKTFSVANLTQGLFVGRYFNTSGSTSFSTNFSNVFSNIFVQLKLLSPVFIVSGYIPAGLPVYTVTQDLVAGTGSITITGISAGEVYEILLTTA